MWIRASVMMTITIIEFNFLDLLAEVMIKHKSIREQLKLNVVLGGGCEHMGIVYSHQKRQRAFK